MKKLLYLGLCAAGLASGQISAMAPSYESIFQRLEAQLQAARQRKAEIEQVLMERGGGDLVNYFRLRMLAGIAEHYERVSAGMRPSLRGGAGSLFPSYVYYQLLSPLENQLMQYQQGATFTPEEAQKIAEYKRLIDRYFNDYSEAVTTLVNEYPDRMGEWGNFNVPMTPVFVSSN